MFVKRIKSENRLKRVCNMKKIVLLAFVMALLVMPLPVQAQEYDPLDEFRVDGSAPARDPNTGTGNTTNEALPNINELEFNPDDINNLNGMPSLELDPDLSIEEQRMIIEQQMRETSYEAALNGLMPMNPEEIRRFLQYYRDTREASEERIGGIPTPEVRVETVSLDPGVAPPVIKLSPGHVTSLTILDITGQPWPVKDVTWGGNFEVISPGEGGHVIRINPMEAHAVGNMSLQLVELKTPVTFSLQTQLEVVQYRFDARIPEYGPLADTPIIEAGIGNMRAAAKDENLTRLLGGVMPNDMELVSVSGVDGRTTVYRHEGRLLLRTPLTLLSPAWDASVKSADGTTVYALPDAPVLLLSDRGRMVRASVMNEEEGYE